MLSPEIGQKITELTALWPESELAARVASSESIASAHGQPDWEGQSIPEYLEHVLVTYTYWLIQNKPALDGCSIEKTEAEKLNEFLAAEQKKIDEADRLTRQMRSYRFGIFDPRYHRDLKKLHEVVASMKLVDKDYKLDLKMNV